MNKILVYPVGLALITQALIGLAFFVSSIWENEKRAVVFGGIQFALMLGLVIGFFYFKAAGFFETGTGQIVLVAMIILALFVFLFLFKKTGSNPKAREGTKG